MVGLLGDAVVGTVVGAAVVGAAVVNWQLGPVHVKSGHLAHWSRVVIL
jgi:hypothetical protein